MCIRDRREGARNHQGGYVIRDWGAVRREWVCLLYTSTGRPLIGDEPFAVVLADDLCLNLEGDSVLKQMVKLYNQFRCSIVAIQELSLIHI